MSSAVRIEKLERQNAELSAELTSLKQQLDWFKRQLFGRKVEPDVQGNLLKELGVADSPPPKDEPGKTVTYQRRKKQRDGAVNDSDLRFGENVPQEVIAVRDPDIEAIPAERRELIGTKVSYRLAQRPGSYVIIEYTRPVYKLLDENRIVTSPAPTKVLDKSMAEVGFLAGMLVDKFYYHLPLYHQHQLLNDAGIRVSRSSLTGWTSRAIDLLQPIVDAQYQHLLQSRVLAMDDTPIKADRQKKGKMRQGYFWPMYGDADKMVFRYASSREHRHVDAFLDGLRSTLLSDGYEAYAAYAKGKNHVTHAQCWVHCRRYFEQTRDSELAASAEALALIGALYRHEAILRERALAGKDKLAYRTQHSEPVVQTFWAWCDLQRHRPELLPSSPLSRALNYARSRRRSSQVFLTDPDMPIDTNHLDQGLRAIPMGKKNYLFTWTEIGAERIGIIQSPLVTCRLQSVDPHTYLVDVLQRISEHPASQALELTPRM